MLTPSDIRNKMFERAKNGYRAEEVQLFLVEVAGQQEYLMDENADLIKKLEILAERLEQYREDEESLRSALIGAQKLGDSVVRDSKRKAEAIIAQATRKSEELVSDAQASISREAMALSKMQVEVAKFKSHILGLYKKHIEIIQEIPYDEASVSALHDDVDLQFMADLDDVDVPASQKREDAEDASEQAVRDKDPMGLVFELATPHLMMTMCSYTKAKMKSRARQRIPMPLRKLPPERKLLAMELCALAMITP